MHPANREDLGETGLDPLVESLSGLDGPADEAGGWPAELWATLERGGVPRWSLPRDFGRRGVRPADAPERYARVAEGSHDGRLHPLAARCRVRRLLAAIDRPVARRWLEAVAAAGRSPTVGISQLTTSRRHGDQAVRPDEARPGRFRLDGLIPWVTAAGRADVLVAGAATDDGRQVLFALPTDRPGRRGPARRSPWRRSRRPARPRWLARASRSRTTTSWPARRRT